MSQLSLEERILVVAPTGSDAWTSVKVLAESGFLAQSYPDIRSLSEAARYGAGALLIAEEALIPDELAILVDMLRDQPSWSDMTVVLITPSTSPSDESKRLYARLSPCGNVTLLERPFRLITLLSWMQGAIRARRRQYQVRALLSQHESDQIQLRAHAAQLEKRVAERTAKLQETISELEAFSYTVSHDLRAPLRGIQGYAHFLLEDADHQLDAGSQAYVQRIQQSAARLDALVQDVLTYSRVSRSEIAFHEIDLEMLLTQIVGENVAFQMPRAYVDLMHPVHPVIAHAASLSQCIANLLGNAIKFVEKDVLPRVVVRTERCDGGVRIWFEDNGIGIDPDVQKKIFGMFERGHVNQGYEGTGIGLAIVKKAMQRMRGEVGVISAPGGGSRFWLKLPAPDESVNPQSPQKVT